MGELLIILLASALLLLWFLSLQMVRDWKHFRKLFGSHVLLLILYSTFFLKIAEEFAFWRDPYRLRPLAGLLFALVTHIVLGFGLSLFIRYRFLKNA